MDKIVLPRFKPTHKILHCHSKTM